MPSLPHVHVKKFIVLILNVLSVLLFIFSLLVMTTDAQGIFIFFFTLPLIFLGQAVCFFLSSRLKKDAYFPRRITWVTTFSLLAFCVFAAIPVLNTIPVQTTNILISAFKKITGKTPRQYFHDRNDLLKLIQSEIEASKNQEDILLSNLKTNREWSTFCVFTPYTSDQAAGNALGVPFSLSLYSDIGSSDSKHMIGLFHQGSLVLYANVSRSSLDFQQTESICVPKEEAILIRLSEKLFKVKKTPTTS
jgi:hypothetical protein